MYLTQWFDPEPNIIKGPDFVRSLISAGHHTTVVTGFPNYPTGKIYDGYRVSTLKVDRMDGFDVHRIPLYPSHSHSSIGRAVNYLSFFLSALIYCLIYRKRFDLIYVYHPPITVGLAAAMAKYVTGVPFILEIQDLWPDTVATSGMSGTSRLGSILGRACNLVYRRSAKIIVQSQSMRRLLEERGVPTHKLHTIRNWADKSALVQKGRKSAGSTDGTGRTRIVYAGNLGRAQALETAIDAAGLAQNIDLVLVGDGVDAEALKLRARAQGLTNVFFVPRMPREEVPEYLQEADGLLIHLRKNELFAATIPSKTQYYLALGRPIIAGVDGETANILNESGAAICTPPEDALALASAMQALAASSKEVKAAMACAGRAYYEQNLAFEKGMRATIDVINQVGRCNGFPIRDEK